MVEGCTSQTNNKSSHAHSGQLQTSEQISVHLQAEEKTIKAQEAINQYCSYLIAQGWCIDTSVKPRAYHAPTNRHADIEHLTYLYQTWMLEADARIDDYAKSLELLRGGLFARIPKIVGTAFRPEPSRFIELSPGVNLVNTYIPFSPAPYFGELPQIWTEYIERMFPLKDDQDMVLDFIADIVQNPLRRPEYGIIVSGQPGTGKSTIVQILRLILGGNHVWQGQSYTDALKQFSHVMVDNLVVAFDDALPKSDTYEKLKFPMTSKKLMVETKFIQNSAEHDVYARVLILTNLDRPFEFDSDDRRFYACEPCELSHDQAEAKVFFKRFYAWLREKETTHFLCSFFKHRDLSGFNHGATVQTAALKRMLGGTPNDIEEALNELTKVGHVYHEEHIRSYLASFGYRFNLDEVDKLMDKQAYKRARRAVHGCRTKQVYVWQPKATKAKILNGKEICDIQKYDEQHAIRLGFVQAHA